MSRARLFCGSFESAIYLLSSICSVPSHTSVVPAINTNFTHHISVSLANGTTITGQNSISHPSISTALENPAIGHSFHEEETEYHDRIEDANLPGSLPTLRKQYITFSKADEEDLPARIERLWYINPYGQEIRLSANPRVLDSLSSAQAIIYSIGSLYTSIVPSLVLKGVGEKISDPAIRYKILILNSTNDRETGPSSSPFSALDFIAAISKACSESRIPSTPKSSNPSSSNHPTSTSSLNPSSNMTKSEYNNYVTHLIHLQGEGTPRVDKEELAELGIECIRVYGRRVEGENFIRYDEKALIQALDVLMGRRDPRLERSRRNTLEG